MFPNLTYHDHNYAAIYGHLLEEGDVLTEDDMYASSNGRWEKCPCPGLTLGKQVGNPLWVRPTQDPK